MRTPCSVEGCTRPHYGHGYCILHWRELVFLPGRPSCEYPGCGRPRRHAHYCRLHHERLRTASNVPVPVRIGVTKSGDKAKVTHLVDAVGYTLCGREARVRTPPRASGWRPCAVCQRHEQRRQEALALWYDTRPTAHIMPR